MTYTDIINEVVAVIDRSDFPVARAEGVVKSMGDGKLVVTAGEKEMTFVTNDATKCAEGVKAGAKVVVSYKKDGENMVAVSVVLVPAAK